ncbi:MAG: NAD-dependent epimerase/dehydratase family protein [Nocardioides sp.]|uniref:NAD-dependent epimerase/dehydratase family protein n=1 Tax=Nocardioides sp. TaxID=35761 RepID=UPI0039E506C7
MSTVLVTGGTGYVASWAIVRLLEEGHDVRTTVRSLDKEEAVRAAVATLVDPGDRLGFHVADLLDDRGWAQALDGVAYVLHVASPLGGADGDPETLIRPAREGALRVLRHAVDAGVERVVMTSAAAAATPADTTTPATTDETLWTDPEGRQLSVYQRSKVLAERAAWDYLAERADNPGATTLTTILPGAVFGPIVSTASRGSTDIVERMLTGRMPGLPDIRLEVVDVRDLVDLHLLAMTAPEAGGQRFLAVSGELMSLRDMGALLRESLGETAGRVPTRRIPGFAIKVAARFQEDMRTLASALGRRHQHSAAKARALLGWEPRPAARTILDTAQSLVEHGVVRA